MKNETDVVRSTVVVNVTMPLDRLDELRRFAQGDEEIHLHVAQVQGGFSETYAESVKRKMDLLAFDSPSAAEDVRNLLLAFLNSYDGSIDIGVIATGICKNEGMKSAYSLIDLLVRSGIGANGKNVSDIGDVFPPGDQAGWRLSNFHPMKRFGSIHSTSVWTLNTKVLDYLRPHVAMFRTE